MLRGPVKAHGPREVYFTGLETLGFPPTLGVEPDELVALLRALPANAGAPRRRDGHGR